MLRIAKHTRLKPAEIIAKVSRFFGKEGIGLEEKERNMCCISFESGGGYVAVSIVDENDRRTVDIETREFEYQAKKFLESL
jgi:hypothetical protein